jgi:uncharacterized protein (DUF1684 family)
VEKQSLVLAVALICANVACREAATPPAAETNVSKAEAPADPYHAEIVKFRQDREASLKGENGWLTIAGLWFLTEPDTTFGSDPLNDIVLPAGAPARAGTFELRNGAVSVKAADDVTFQLNDKPITTATLKPDGQGAPDRIGVGDLQLWVHNSGDRLSIRLRDRNNPLRTSFTGTKWFPIDPAYRVEAVYKPFDKPKMVDVANILGDADQVEIPGLVTFSLNGQEYSLEPFAEPGRFWFVFRDLTSLKETYPAARFLYTPAPVDGKMTLDFNRAENPPCAYNPYTTCPLPTEQNRLRTRIEAGEMRYEAH